ncbi:MAG: type II secretion system protein GspL [Pseudomonadota bacterium]
MRNTLLLRVGKTPGDPCEWVLLGADGQPTGTVQAGMLAEAATAANGLRVTVLVPASDCLLTSVSIPGTNRQKLLRAVPYALEEQLTTDVEDLHFAVGPALGNGSHAVAIIAIQRMESIVESCYEAGLDISHVMPEQLAVPCSEDTTCIVYERDLALVRTGSYAGFAVDPENLGMILTRQSVADDAVDNPVHIYLPAGTELPELGVGGAAAQIGYYHGSVLGLLAIGAGSPSIDLLQGAYSHSQDWGKLWRPWRATAALLLAVFVVSNVVMAINYFRLDSEQAELTSRISEIYKQTFPDTKRVVNPRVQMQQQLERLQRSQGGGGFMVLLARAGDVLRSNEGIEISAANFRAGRLDVDLTASNLQVLDQLKQTLAGKGLTVEIQTATTEADQRVKSRLRIRGDSA